MELIDKDAARYAIKKIKDGWIFEKFGHEFLSAKLSYNFSPIGGQHDRGIDGLEHLLTKQGRERAVYQLSIEKNYKSKLEITITKLEENGINYDSLCFVTNQKFEEQDIVIDDLSHKYQKNIRIYDIDWIVNNLNNSQGTINAYNNFAKRNLHEYNQPGNSKIISDLVGDPRIYVFLRQQFESNHNFQELDLILADTLILFALEDTDPDLLRVKTKEQVIETIRDLIKFDPRFIEKTIGERLEILSKEKPRKIKFHSKQKGYLLPFETRCKVQERNIKDAELHDEFIKSAEGILRSYLKDANVEVKDKVGLLEKTFHQLFHQQGLEFANFILQNIDKLEIEKDIRPVISNVVDEASVIIKNKEAVKIALQLAIRDIVYNGTAKQKEFLTRLSNTYMMLFMLQCDPKLSLYFHSMANKLKVYVCTSIIIPAISEFYLNPVNQRFTNLLKRAHRAGVTLIINDTIIKELVAHFKLIKKRYHEEYESYENIYASESSTLYIDEILIRSYFYSKIEHPHLTFNKFLDNFVNPDLSNAEESLKIWLEETFGIKYITDKSLNIKLSESEIKLLEKALTETKKSSEKARNDASVILTIFALREKNNEPDGPGMFAYKTWWLSKDTRTYSAVEKVLGDTYKVSCYIRPDFLYNYIALSPTPDEVDAAYDNLFPSLLGINISWNLPKDVIDTVQLFIVEFGEKESNPGRLKAILHQLSTKLKTDPSSHNRKSVTHYLEEQKKLLLQQYP